MSRGRKIDVRAAGALVWRPARSGKDIDVLVIHRPRRKDWSFPKGKLKTGEPLHRCAIREVYEETGRHVILGQPIGWQYYETADGKWKEVRYWAARVVDESHVAVRARPKFNRARHAEVDESAWVSSEKAAQLLTYREDREFLERLMRMHRAGHLDSVPLCFVRHTRAKSRSAWKKGHDSEATRPLTALGEKRARKLAEPLSDYGIQRLVSSPWKRCVDTLAPYASLAGIKLKTDVSLTEVSYRKSHGGVEKAVRAGIEKGNGYTAISLHRPTLPSVLVVLGAYTKKSILKQIPKADPWLRTGEVIVAHVVRQGKSKPIVVSLEKHRPVVHD